MHGPITEEILARKPWLAGYGARIPADINPDAHGSVLHMFEAAMRLYAGRPAFRCFGRTLSYADTDHLSRNFAAFLQRTLGVRKGDRVAVMLPNLPAFALAMLGIVRAGAVQVNVNPLYTARELERQLKDFGRQSHRDFQRLYTDTRRNRRQHQNPACDHGRDRRRHRRQPAEPAGGRKAFACRRLR
jgi:acyl-CoA synthetase (AMP-forming)/AMP-acid ligase II